MDDLLKSILVTKRSHNSKGELDFLKNLHSQLAEYKPVTLAEGCLAVTVGEPNGVMFSCHIDTVHNMNESDGTEQVILYDEALGHIFVDGKSSCLGADDGAGIYIMLSMIFAKKQGTYVFHRGEERGCIGSRGILAKNLDFVKKFKQCVAFDRPNNYEVIIMQGGQPCASQTYGEELAKRLTALGLTYETSNRGVITDSKIYKDYIPECVNLGVGYANQHSDQEYQDVEHLIKLKDAAIAIDWNTLPVARIPTPPPAFVGNYGGFNNDREVFQNPWDAKNLRNFRQPKKSKGAKAKPILVKPFNHDEDDPIYDLKSMDYAELEGALIDPDMVQAVVSLLCELDQAKGRISRLNKLLGM